MVFDDISIYLEIIFEKVKLRIFDKMIFKNIL